MDIKSAIEMKSIADGKEATVAGCVITRQRPGTAKGLIFMTLEDETGTARVIIKPDFYENNRMAVLHERFVQVSGTVQNRDGVANLIAKQIRPIAISTVEMSSHDFH
jgi:error-prone DNA polymerase